MVEVQTEGFLRFLLAARDPLRRFAWSRFENWGLFTISAGRARPSAEIVRVEALSLWRRAINGLWKLSRGLRACFRNPAVAGSIPPWSAAAPA